MILCIGYSDDYHGEEDFETEFDSNENDFNKESVISPTKNEVAEISEEEESMPLVDF